MRPNGMRNVMIQRDVVKSGVGFGSALAMVISYSAYKSVLWAIIHGIFGWFYVGYFLLTR
jgi:hypothetical protein